MIDTAELRLSMFEPLLGTTFRTEGAGCADTLKLTAADALKDLSGRGRSA